ncbi:uncharacterized protein LOC141852062 [Brevipalpus obovatus]|uniref:uncharacterized protein LOC141852062 n=1 Tax=Brevipalpus obovatus TaxID=246614 RepID=UPI003D9E84B4
MIQLHRNNFRILQPPSSHLSFIHSTSHYLSIIMILIISIVLCGIIDLEYRTVQADIIPLSPFIHHLIPSPLIALSRKSSTPSTIDTRPVIKRRSDRLESTLHSIVDSLLTPIHSERSPNGWRGYVFVDPLFKPSSSSPSSNVQSSLSSKIMLPTSVPDSRGSSGSVFQGSESEPIPYIVNPPADMYMSSSNNRHTRRMADGRRAASASSTTYTYRFPSLHGGNGDDDSEEEVAPASSSKKKSSSTRKRSTSTRTTTAKPSPAISIGHSSEGGTSIRLGKAQITFKKGSISLGPAEDPIPEASSSSSKSTASPNKVPNSNQRDRSSPLPSKLQPQEEHLPPSSRYSSRRSRRPLRPDQINPDRPLSEENDEVYGPTYVSEEEDGETDYGSEYSKSNQDPLYKASASGYYNSYKPFQTGRIQSQRKRGRYGYSPPALFPELMDDTTTASTTSLSSTVSSTKLKSRGKAKRRTVNSSARLASNRDKLLNFDDYEPSSDVDENREMTASKAEKLRKLRQRLGISEDYDDKENSKSKIKIQEQHGNGKKTLLDQIEDDDDEFFIKGTDLLNMPVSSVDKKIESKKREKKMTDTESSSNPAKVSLVDDSDEDEGISKFLAEENSRSHRKSGKMGSESSERDDDDEPEMSSSKKKKGSSSSSSSIDTESKNLRKEHRSTVSDDPDDDSTATGEVRNDRQRSNTSSSSSSSSGSSRSNRNRKQRLPPNREESSSESTRSTTSSSSTRNRKNKKQSTPRSESGVEIITRSPNEKSGEDADRVYFGASNPKTRVGASKKSNQSSRKIVAEESDDEDIDLRDTKNEMSDKNSPTKFEKSGKSDEDKVLDTKSENYKTSTEETPIPVGPYEKVGNVYQIRLTSRVAPVKESGDEDGEKGGPRAGGGEEGGKKRKTKIDQTHDDDIDDGDLNVKNITAEKILTEKAEELAFKKLFFLMQETLADIKKTANQKVTPCPPELNSTNSSIDASSTKSIVKNQDSTDLGSRQVKSDKGNTTFIMEPVEENKGVNISLINPLMNVTSISELMKMLVKSGQIISSSQIVPISSTLPQHSSGKNDSSLYVDRKDSNQSKSKKTESIGASNFSIEPMKDSSKEFNDYTIDLDPISSESAKQRKSGTEKSTTSRPEVKSTTVKEEITSPSPKPEVTTTSSVKSTVNDSNSSGKTNDNDVPIIVVLLPPELENSSR